MVGAIASATELEPVIGVEVHVQLATATKMFCGCRVQYGALANSLTCPVCLGLPGALPVPNDRAVEFAIRIGLALGCKIARRTHFDRKNYFYPDLTKGYQISQYDEPICYDGSLEIPVSDPVTGFNRRISVIRAHMEEDTGKSIHMDGFSLLDFNRCGTPLVEIVSGPDMRSADEAHAYLTTLRRNLSYLAVSPLSMEKGSLRCDLNVSLRPRGQSTLPDYKVEIKNLNSFAGARRAIENEIGRQRALLERGDRPSNETRLWDDQAGESRAMRSKELANDYRYFPEPDIPALLIDPARIERISRELPEMPDQRMARFMEAHKLKREDAEALVEDALVADFFEAVLREFPHPAKAAHWMFGEVARVLNERAIGLDDLVVTPSQVAQTLALLETGQLNNITAKEVFAELVKRSFDAAGSNTPLPTAHDIAVELNKLILRDDPETDRVLEEVIAEFAKAVGEYRSGKTQTLGFLVGQCMRKLRGKADPKALQERLVARLAQ